MDVTQILVQTAFKSELKWVFMSIFVMKGQHRPQRFKGHFGVIKPRKFQKKRGERCRTDADFLPFAAAISGHLFLSFPAF